MDHVPTEVDNQDGHQAEVHSHQGRVAEDADLLEAKNSMWACQRPENPVRRGDQDPCRVQVAKVFEQLEDSHREDKVH